MLVSLASLITLSSAVLALPAERQSLSTSASKKGSALSDGYLSIDRRSLEKRLTCTTNTDCQSLTPLANAARVCTNGSCAYQCFLGYGWSKSRQNCARLSVAGTTRSARTVAGATTTTRAAVATPTTTTTTPPPATTTTAAAVVNPSGVPGSVQQLSLKAHNDFRALHGANPLVWDTALAKVAQDWANACFWGHGGYKNVPSPGAGENLAAWSGSSKTITDGIQLWMDEAPDYNPANPMYSHFTQMVWKATTKLGCAEANCPAGTVFATYPAKYWVCEYQVPGNAGGPDQYRLNVQP